MGIYRKICYYVEDIIINLTTKREQLSEARDNARAYRQMQESESLRRKQAKEQQRLEREKQQREREGKERAEVELILNKMVDTDKMSYTQYEYRAVRQNRQFFLNVLARVFEPDEKGLTFIFCEFDKSKRREIKGYLIVTNKRVLFLTNDLHFMEKYRYQTIINVSWFRDGGLEKGLRIQYGKRTLEFDEMFDFNQLKRVGDLILQLSTNH